MDLQLGEGLRQAGGRPKKRRFRSYARFNHFNSGVQSSWCSRICCEW